MQNDALSYNDWVTIVSEETRIAREKAANGKFIWFTLETMPDYDPNWHHLEIHRQLQDWVNGIGPQNLILVVPPRHGKSEIGSVRLPPFIFGVKPNSRIIATSYSSDLAAKNNRQVQRVIDSNEYRSIFPNTYLATSNTRTMSNRAVRNADEFEIVGHKGTYRGAGVGGAITGFGADYFIIDDPIKNQEEADSPTYRQKLWEWWISTAFTRLEQNSRVLLIVTRWHEDDLAGRLLDLAKKDPTSLQWKEIKYEAIKEDLSNPTDPRSPGEPLWPNKYPLARLNTIRSTIGSRWWNSLYQQTPKSPAGAIIKRSWIKFYKVLPDQPVDKSCQSWDLAFKDSKESDFVNGDVWKKFGARFYLCDNMRDRMDFTSSIRSIRSMTAKHPNVFRKLIEDKANGPAVISSLQNEISGIIPVNPKTSKAARGHAVAPLWEAGNVYLPDPTIAPWILDWIEEVVGFPTAKNDDRFDTMTQALLDLAGERVADFTSKMVPTDDEDQTDEEGEDYKW